MKHFLRNLMLFGIATAMFVACGKEPGATKKIIKNGAITAEFSVSGTKRVYFSQGNLQYQASTGIWRFAENQWDFVGTHSNENEEGNRGTVEGSDNVNVSESYNGWIDLFGWGTSGWKNRGAKAYQPYSISQNNSDYNPGGDYTNNLTGDYENADWGIYNVISNGGNKAGLWRTLTDDEWYYLINSRANALSKRGVATVNNVNGLILLPDNWTLPNGITFTSGVTNQEDSEYYKAVNNYSYEDWSKMEANGAVFLPAAGERWNNNITGLYVYAAGWYGRYWSSSTNYDYTAGSLVFSWHIIITTDDFNRSEGLSVRLVQDVK